MRFDGQSVIVTGGAHGMGRSTALAFLREGAHVVVGDIDQAAGEALAEEAGEGLIFQRCDMSDERDVEALVATAVSQFGGLDAMFNNAGIEQPVTPSHELTEEMFERVISINLKGVFFGCKHAIRAMLATGGGAIVNNSSVSAFANVGGNLSYASSKGGIMSMTRVLAVEYATRGIRVNAINPGVIDTGMNRRNLDLAADPAAVEEKWKAITPLGRMGTGDEIAETVMFLCSPGAGFITGVGLLVDGGRVAT
ncbi:SDR family NAD(P)-dependent oxidoreductase [Primorskyibacter sedentarius]|uniref:SDR family NAD(P)-dependent oxidoreductase n=1 Tax=Primorskyibacter sedentarius TaxID=745311 RepID=UPI003EBF5DF7